MSKGAGLAVLMVLVGFLFFWILFSFKVAAEICLSAVVGWAGWWMMARRG